MGITEEAGKVGTAAVGAMASTPLAIALLIVNIGFLGFAGYVLGEVAQSARERNSSQMDMIKQLVTDIRDCRQGPKPTDWPINFNDIYKPSFE
jgi:Tfp pilus assembly protein PilV